MYEYLYLGAYYQPINQIGYYLIEALHIAWRVACVTIFDNLLECILLRSSCHHFIVLVGAYLPTYLMH